MAIIEHLPIFRNWYPAAVGESSCCARRSKRKRAARSSVALRRAAHYPLSLPPYCKALWAFLGVQGHNAPLVRNSGPPQLVVREPPCPTSNTTPTLEKERD